MVRRYLPALVAVLAVLVVSSAGAQTRVELWPGVTYTTGVQFTPHGPVAISIMTGPRPGGTTTLAPVLSGNTLTGRATVTAMQREIASSATVAGVNGDFSSFIDGTPSGVLLRDGQLDNPPYGDRSSLGITQDGTLDVRRIEFFGTWQGSGPRRVLNAMSNAPEPNQISLYTSSYGSTTPVVPGSRAAILFPFPAAVPGADLEAPVVEFRNATSVPIPIGGAVLVARGTAAATLEAEAIVGSSVVVQLVFRPEWQGVTNAIGGGPVIVRNGAPVFRAGEAFTTAQLSPRAPRTGVGQLADGRVILVAVDGRQPGYSTGLTNFELAQTMVRLGAVSAIAMDGGGSTAMAFDGKLLNRPSDSGGERPVGNALFFLYTGVYMGPTPAVISPNGDGVDEAARLSYKLVRPSTVTVVSTGPNGTPTPSEPVAQQPGAYTIPFGTAGTTPTEGKWRIQVAAVDELGQPSTMTRAFRVDSTLGFLRLRYVLFVPPLGRDWPISWTLSRAARVKVTVETTTGTVVRTLALRRYDAGTHGVAWNGLGRDRKRVAGGTYVVRVVANSTLGRSELTRKTRVRQVVGPRR